MYELQYYVILYCYIVMVRERTTNFVEINPMLVGW
jgi:hypothetical protein